MQRASTVKNSRFGELFAAAAIVLAACSTKTFAQSGTLAQPVSFTASNGAIHYQRGLLHLADLSRSDRKLLDRPIWEVLPEGPDGLPRSVERLLQQQQLAVRAAGQGSRQARCDFGIHFQTYGPATSLPHVTSMLRLSRLLALRGAYAEREGKWKEAAVIYFDGLRMGRHMTEQATLLEALVGLEILRDNHYALALWGARCPDRAQVARAFGLYESIAANPVNPSRILASESAILAMQLDELAHAFPDGRWAEMILDSLDPPPAGLDGQNLRNQIVDLCVKQGVPRDAFASKQAFRDYVSQLRQVTTRFVEAAATTMTLPPVARAKRGTQLFARYSKLIGPVGQDVLVSPAEIGNLFAAHEADVAIVRTALAIAASRTDKGYPENLATITRRFGGRPPISPYDGSPLVYEVYDSGKGFSLTIPEYRRDGVVLPQVDFDSTPPVVAAE